MMEIIEWRLFLRESNLQSPGYDLLIGRKAVHLKTLLSDPVHLNK